MENRKLIAFGTNSFVISMPKTWVEKNELKKGDIVNISESNNEIIITPEINNSKNFQKIINININHKSISLIRTEIYTAYLKGFDEIIIKGDNLDNLIKDLRIILFKLSGLEVMHLTSNEMKIKNLLSEKNVSIIEVIKRTHSMLISMMDFTKKCFDEDVSKIISERDIDINRMVFLATRVMRKSLTDKELLRNINLNITEIIIYWQILLTMERIGDQLKRIARYSNNIKIEKNELKKIKKIYFSLNEQYCEVMQYFFKENNKIPYSTATNIKKEISEKCYLITDKNSNSNILHVIENFKNMSASIERIAQNILTMD